MSACCSGYGRSATCHFGPDRAAADLARYRERGPDPTTRLLSEELRALAPTPFSLLDVGGGIGALAYEMLEHASAAAVVVEASAAYLDAARQEADRRGLAERIAFAEGDFVEIAPKMAPADLVTMDRVVCCYPSARPLLEAPLGHASRYFALSYPRERWYVRALTACENLVRRLRRDAFRTYMHPEAAMHAVATEHGFEVVRQRRTTVWSVEVWRRMA